MRQARGRLRMTSDVFPVEYPKQRVQLHVNSLLVQHGIKAFVSSRIREWSSNYEYRIVVCPRLTSDSAYAIWLHELGHIVIQSHDETTAWSWAQAHALFWSPRMTTMRDLGLGTYVTYSIPSSWPRRRFDSVLSAAAFCSPYRPLND